MSCAALELREVAEVPYGMDAREESDDDRIEHLEDEIAVLAAHIHAATHRLLVLIAEFDRLGGWERFGYPDCAHWLSVRTGVDIHMKRYLSGSGLPCSMSLMRSRLSASVSS